MLGVLSAGAAANESQFRKQPTELVKRFFGRVLGAAEGQNIEPSQFERFLSDYAAVVAPSEDRSVLSSEHGLLVESTTPLRTRDGDGVLRPIDLSLKSEGQTLQPRNPLVEVRLPGRLGEGISLPQLEIGISLPGAIPGREPARLGGGALLYPHAERDLSFIALPTATGFETLSMLESPAALRAETFALDLPPGASLRPTGDGGATVLRGEEEILQILPPTATDAQGEPVPTQMQVSGTSFTVAVSPEKKTVFPILVDPIYQTYTWSGGSTGGLSNWSSTSNISAYAPATQINCGTNCVAGETANTPGLYVGANPGSAAAGSSAYWSYFVPRYQSDKSQYGNLPTSFVSSVEFNNVKFFRRSDSAASPALVAGIWAGTAAPVWGGPNNWVGQVTHFGNQGDWTNETINLSNPSSNQNAKWVIAGIGATESRSLTSYRDAYFGGAQVALSDTASPVLSGIVPPTEWFDASAPPVPVTAEDTGLGVFSFTSKEVGNPSNTWQYSLGCTGTASSPCPRVWSSSEGSPQLNGWPSVLAEGIDEIAVTGSDPVGNLSEAKYVKVRIDHSAPVVSLSGALTESGPKRLGPGKYGLHVAATDGSEGKPRSGVKSIAIEVDGSLVPGTVEQTCPGGSCPASRDWTFDVNSYSNGEHGIKVLVKDQLNHIAKSEFQVTVDKSRIYWGAWMDGDVALMPREGEKPVRGDAPWDKETWDLFEKHAGNKKVSIVHFGQPPPWIEPEFQPGPLNLTIERGAIPMMDMRNDAEELPTHVSLADIVEGEVDGVFKKWAETVAGYKKPFFFRWDWEMNGNWNSWGKEAGHNPELYVEAWEHLHDIAENAGAKNLTWVWCPNIEGPNASSMEPFLPSETKYVDWTCLDGYNWGTSPVQSDSWKGFKTIFASGYEKLLELAPSKPIMIGETASTEFGESKAAWIEDALATQIPINFPKIKAVVWFNWNDPKPLGRMDWPIESSGSAESAFASAIASPNYAAGGAELESLPTLAPVAPLP